AKEQQLSSEADLGGNLHPAGLAPALSAGLRNVPFRGAAFQLLGFDVTSNCTLTFCANLPQTSAAREAYIRLNKLTDAEHWYRESLRAKPDHIPAHLTYGKLLAMTGQKTEAERYFLKAIQLDPTKGNCYMHYGVHLRFTALSGSNNSNSSRTRNKTRTFREEHFHLKETDPSRSCFNSAAVLSPALPGQFLLEESRLLEAAEMAEKAARLDSGEFDVVFSAAHMLRQASLNEAAEKYYGQAASLRPNYPAALMNLGAILHLNGKLQQAEANYLRALELKPDDTITQSNLRKLWNIMEKQGLRTMSP
ncbi:hypothetical protein NQZ68_041633, partial [Dissostichus eleginoides]